jgi:hypothetical protein
MRPLAANQRLGSEPLRIEWMRLSPYAPAGRFTSRVFDAGAPAMWQALTWDASVPESTSLTVEVRTGDAPRPGAGWSSWRSLAPSGEPLGATSRYLQYRAHLATTNPSRTPALRQVRVSYSAAGSSSSSLGATNVLGCQ